MPKRVLIIDDEAMVLDALTVILEDMGYAITPCLDSQEGVRTAVDGQFDLILCDLRMPGKNGAQVTREIMDKSPNAKILIVTAFPSDPLAEQALSAGAIALVKKPFEITKILEYLKD
ncbi:MAG TPA: response regulator [Spirochaetia bacterium]|nr:response regulator [Spirochaetia bacterium]